MKQGLIRILLLLLPVMLTPVWGFLVAEGIINLGGGEKDLLLLVPYLIWSVLYLVAGIVFWKNEVRRMVLRALLYSTGIMLMLWGGLLIYSMAG